MTTPSVAGDVDLVGRQPSWLSGIIWSRRGVEDRRAGVPRDG